MTAKNKKRQFSRMQKIVLICLYVNCMSNWQILLPHTPMKPLAVHASFL